MKEYRPFIIAAACVLLIAAGYTVAILRGIGEPTVRGQFGDMYGGLNAIFSGLAFAGIIATIIMQRQELELQGEELKLTRLEMERSREELRLSAEAQTKSSEALIAQNRLASLNSLITVYLNLLEVTRSNMKFYSDAKMLDDLDVAQKRAKRLREKITHISGELEKEAHINEHFDELL